MDASALITDPHPMLHRPLGAVQEFTAGLTEVAREMHAVMRTLGGVGLAAPQVGLPLRMFVLEAHGVSLTALNPVVLTTSGYRSVPEGCLSLPGVRCMAERPSVVGVSWHDLEGRIHSAEFTGLLAQIWCHEVDHLDGVLMLDRCDPASVRTV
jgi:peptide deformylase